MPLTDDKFDSLDQRQSPLMNKFDLLMIKDDHYDDLR